MTFLNSKQRISNMLSLVQLFESLLQNKINNDICIEESKNSTVIVFKLNEKSIDEDGKIGAYAGEFSISLKDMKIDKEYDFHLGIHQHSWEYWKNAMKRSDQIVKFGKYTGMGKLSRSNKDTNDFTFTSSLFPGKYKIISKQTGIFKKLSEIIVRIQ